MTHSQFVIAMTIVLFLAVGLGWFASWLTHRLTRVTQADIGALDEMASHLHDAEETRDEALAYMDEREGMLTRELAETQAELRAAMEGLRDARAEAEELRDYIQRQSRG